jgi:hypothetical protein
MVVARRTGYGVGRGGLRTRGGGRVLEKILPDGGKDRPAAGSCHADAIHIHKELKA